MAFSLSKEKYGGTSQAVCPRNLYIYTYTYIYIDIDTYRSFLIYLLLFVYTSIWRVIRVSVHYTIQSPYRKGLKRLNGIPLNTDYLYTVWRHADMH